MLWVRSFRTAFGQELVQRLFGRSSTADERSRRCEASRMRGCRGAGGERAYAARTCGTLASSAVSPSAAVGCVNMPSRSMV